MKLLIIYSSTEGHTKKIAEFLRVEAEKTEHVTSAVTSPPLYQLPHDYDAVIICASLHAGQYQNELIDYVSKYSDQLNHMPTVFFSVGLSITRQDPKTLNSLHESTQFFLNVTKWTPLVVKQVAGALLYTKYGFIKKMLVRSIMKKAGGDTDISRDFEYTDWNALKKSLQCFIEENALIAV